MRVIVKVWLERLLAALMMICIASGIILMMCESENAQTQYKTLFIGFGLFLIGVVPGMIIGWRERENG